MKLEIFCQSIYRLISFFQFILNSFCYSVCNGHSSEEKFHAKLPHITRAWGKISKEITNSEKKQKNKQNIEMDCVKCLAAGTSVRAAVMDN